MWILYLELLSCSFFLFECLEYRQMFVLWSCLLSSLLSLVFISTPFLLCNGLYFLVLILHYFMLEFVVLFYVLLDFVLEYDYVRISLVFLELCSCRSRISWSEVGFCGWSVYYLLSCAWYHVLRSPSVLVDVNMNCEECLDYPLQRPFISMQYFFHMCAQIIPQFKWFLRIALQVFGTLYLCCFLLFPL